MALITRDLLFSHDDLTFEDVPVSEWGPGAEIRIRRLTGDERDEFEESLVRERRDGKKVTREAHMKGARAKLVALSAIKADGSRLFIAGDVDQLGRKSAAPLDRCFKVAMRLSGMTEEEVEKLGEDSAATPNAASSSDSLLG